MSKLFKNGNSGKKPRKAAKKKQNLQLEALENRVLLSADLGIAATDLNQSEVQATEVIESELQLQSIDPNEFEPQSIAVDDSLSRLADELAAQTQDQPEKPATPAAESPATETPQEQTLTPEALYLMERMQASEIIIVDASIPQLDSVVKELLQQSETDLVQAVEHQVLQANGTELAESPAAADQDEDVELAGMSIEQQVLFNADRDVKVFVLDAEQDGVEQIGSILDYFEDVAAVHLLSHGSAGALFLGNSKLNNQQLRQNSAQMKRWGEALSEDGDLLLYGCNLADGAMGLEFIDQLAELTGADVAASDDDTGNSADADWDLEQRVGEVETAALISSSMQGVLNATGTTGNDTLTDKTGTVKGLAGNDTYDFNSLPASKVTVTELKNEGTDTLDLSGISSNLTITIKKDNTVEVKNSSGTVKITATYVENIIGGSGNDTFYVQKGAELKGYIDGGAGTNTLSYTDPNAGLLSDKSYTGSVLADFGTNADQNGKATAIDSLAANGIRNIDAVVGGKKTDFLKGGSGADDLSGGKGDDALSGNAGVDTLRGDAGDDWLDGGAGADIVEGGAGNDVLLASAGGDTLKGESGDDTYQFSDSADWNGTTVTETTNSGTDTLDFSLVTADLTFTLNDMAATGVAIAATGKTVSGAKEIEKLIAGTGINTFNFKNGWADQLLIEATAAATVNLDFSAVTSDLFITFRADGSVEIADTANRSGGHRAIVENVDAITGGAGTNTFIFEKGASYAGVLTGGSSTNLLDYSKFGVAVDLKTNPNPNPPGVTGSVSGTFQVVGSTKQDLLQAEATGQTLSGGVGDDYLIGGLAADTLSGDKGDDTFVGGAGNDSFDGGKGDDTYYFGSGWGQDTGITEAAKGGTDTISFAGMDAVAATADLAAVDAVLAAAADLTFNFDAGALNVSDGNGAGANTLAVAATSLAHIEHILGGGQVNTYEFENNWWQGGNKSINLDDSASTNGTLDFSAVTTDLKFVISDDNGVTVVTVTTVVSNTVYTVTARGIENLIGGMGDNQYQFEAGASLSGSLTGFSGTGANQGTATLDFSDYDKAVAVDLTAATATADAGAISLVGATLSNINHLTGSDYDDTLTGNSGENTLRGGAGADTIKGGAGADILIGGKGSDNLDGEGGADTYKVETQWSKLDLGQILGQADTITDTSGNNILDLTDISKDLKLTFTKDATSGTNVTVAVALPGGVLSNKIQMNQTGSGWTINRHALLGDDTVIVKDGVDFGGQLNTGGGDNVLDYYHGTDVSGGYKSSVTVDLAAGTATGFSGIAGIDDIFGSFSGGADSLTGDDNDNTFYVGAWGEIDGDNSRKHSIDGGSDGSDTVSFLTFDQSDFAITADLTAGTVTHEKADTTIQTVADLVGIENLTGGAGDDTLIGDALVNILNGGAGNDSLQGGAGDDIYRFDSGFGLDTVVDALDAGDDTLDFAGVSENLTFNNGRLDATEVDLTTALTQAVTVTDGTNTLTTDFNVERFSGVKDTDTLQQANVTIDVAVQDDMISGLEALKAVVDALSSGYTEFSDFMQLDLPLIGSALGDLMKHGDGTAVDFATVIGVQLQTRIDALKTLFWGDLTEPDAASKAASTTDQLLALQDAGGNDLFRISENTRLLEVATTLDLFENTQSLGLDLGGTLSAIPGLNVDLNPDVRTKGTFDFAFGVLPSDPAVPDADLNFHVADPSLNLSVTLFDNAINAGLDFGVIAAAVDNGSLSMTLGLELMAQGDLSELILLDALDSGVPAVSLDSLFSLKTSSDTGITAELPISVNTAGLGIDLPSLPTITLTTPDFPEFPSLTELGDLFANLDWDLPDLSELLDLSSISMDQLFAMLRSGLSYLVDNFDFSMKIPGIDLSLDDIFKNIPGLELGLQDFLNNLLSPLDSFDLSLGLQGLADYLNAELAKLLPSFPALALPQFDFGWDGFNLDIDFDFDVNLADLLAAMSLPELAIGFDFDLADLTSFLNLPAGFDPAQLGITMAADGKLLVDADLDIDLELDFAVQEYVKAVALNSGPSGLNIQDYAFIGDDTQIAIEARAGGEDIDVEASLSISDSLPAIGFWIEDGTAIIQAAAAIALPQVSNGRYQLSGFNVSDFDFNAGGEANIDLPMFLGTGSLPMGGSESDLNGDGYADNVLHAGFDFDLSGMSGQEVIAPNFAGFNLIAFLNDPATILAGLEGMFGGIKTMMVDQLGQLGLPFIGDVLKDSGAFVDQLRDNMLGVKTAGAYAAGSLGKSLQDAAANGDDVISLIRDAMFNELGDYLQVVSTDADGNPLFNDIGNILYRDVQSADDIGLVLTPEGELTFNVLLAGSVFEGLNDYRVRYSDADPTIIEKRYLEAPINFDLSAPGLGLKTGPNDKIEISLDYFFGLGFGLDQSGFFLDTAGVTAAGEELGLTLDASLSDGASLSGTLGFLQMSLEEIDDDDGNSGLRGKIAIDITDNDDDRWRVGEALELAAQISADANVDLLATVDMDFGGQDISLPGAHTKIHYDQELANITWSTGSTFSANFFETPQVVLEDVTLNVGDLFSGFIGPIALELDPFLGKDSELRRVIDILTTEVDLGITKLNLLDIAVLAMNAKSAGTGDTLRTTITALKAVSDFITLAKEAAESNTPIEVNFGTFDLGGSLVTSDSSSISNSDLNQSGQQQDSSQAVANSNASASQKQLVTQLGTSPGSIMFPILYDPMTAVGLLLGKDVDLFIYDTPDINFLVEYEQSFPIFTGLNAVIKGTLEAYSDFYFGFDTTGIRSWFEKFEASDFDFDAAVGNLDDIFDGFFIADWAVNDQGVLQEGDDVAEVTLTVTFAAGAALGIGGLVEAGVLGGIEAEIGLNLHDLPKPGTGGDNQPPAIYDGKIRFDEVATIIQHNPLCLFDMEGAIKAFLEAYLWVGVKVFGSKITLFEASKRFVEVTLATFEWTCPEFPDPEVATIQNGVMTLAYKDDQGNRAAQEQYTVSMEDVDLTDDNVDNPIAMIMVNGNGHTEYFDPNLVNKIVAHGTDGKDIFEISTNIDADLEIHGGGDDDYIILTGQQNENRSRKIYGDGGNDTLIGTNMSEYIEGGTGNDNIRSKQGVDTIFGGAGDDFIWAEGDAVGTSGLTNGFSNYIDAGDGADRVLTGDGADKIITGAGDDTVDSGAGADDIDTGAGSDYIDAGEGADTIVAGSGDDSLNWEVGDGADDFSGGTGTDEIFMAGYQINPEQFYETDTSQYIVDDAKTDTVTVSDAAGKTNIAWQHGTDAGITLTSSGVETLSLDTGRGADDIVIGNLKNTVTDNVKVSTGKQRVLGTENRKVKVRNDDGDLVDGTETQSFKILQESDDNAVDTVRVEGTAGADEYLISTVESTGIDGNAQTAIRYEQLDGGTDAAENPTSHVIVDVYDLEASDKTKLETLAGNDSINAQGVTQQVVSELFMDGGADDDIIIGSSLAGTSDVIIGGTGSDRLTGAVGVDKFYEQSVTGDSNNAGDVDVLVEKRDADFILKNQQLVIDDSDLSNQYGNETENFAQIFENAELTGLDSANDFEVANWSGGGILDGGKGGDSYTLELAQLASGRQYLNIDDTGASGIDSLIYKGSAGDDTIQLDTVYKRDEDVEKRFTDSRWTGYGDHGDGLIIAHFDSSDSFAKADLDNEDALMQVNESGLSAGSDYQVVNYDSVEQVTVFGGEGHDKFISDSSATQIDVFGDGGDDQFYVGSVLKTDTVLVEGQEVTIVEEITDGANFNGSAFFGGEGDDYFEVNHNAADIGLYGDNGDDTFFIKALLTLDDDGELLDIDSGTANVSGVSQGENPNDTREVDVDTLVYVENANVSIDGGAGFDSVAIVGTVLSDTFYVFVERDEDTGEMVQRIYGAGIKLQKLLNIERLQLLTGGGDDTVYIYGVDMGLIGDMVVKTGSGSDTVHVGGPEQIINLNFPKNNDLYYSQVEGFKVDQDAEGNFQYAGMVSGMPFYRIDEVDRVVPFEVENPARTLQITMPESYDISSFVSPVLIDGGEGVHDQIIVNNQQGASQIRFANTELQRKEVTFDYDAFSFTGGAGDFVTTMLADADAGSVAQDLLGSATGDYIRFQDRYYDTSLVDNLNSDSVSQMVIPEGLSYFNIQNTLQSDGSISYARDELIDLAAKFNLTLDWTIVDHPDPTRADPDGDGDTSDGEKLYELLSITTAGGDAVAFEAQHKETVIYDINGNVAILKDITALTLKTTADLTVDISTGSVTNVEQVRTDAMNTLGVIGEAPELHITGMNDITLNLSEKDSVNGSVLEVDNNLFGTDSVTDQGGNTQTVETSDKLYIQGGSEKDDIRIQQTAAEVIAHGNDGDDQITVGKDGRMDEIGDQVYLYGDAGDDTIILDREQDDTDADVEVDKNLVQHSTGFEQLSRITSALSLQNITNDENTLLEQKLKEATEPYADEAFAVNSGDLNTAADEIGEAALNQLLEVLQNGKTELASSVSDAADTLRLNDQLLLENQIKLYTRAKYYADNNIDDALLNKLSTMGVWSNFNVAYTYNLLGIDFGPYTAHNYWGGVQGGFNNAEDWLRNFGSRVDIKDDDGNAQTVNVNAAGNRSILQQLLEDDNGNSDIYSLINDALINLSETVFTASENDGDWLDVNFKLSLYTVAVHSANDNKVRAYAKIYDTLVNDYIGTQQIYYDLLTNRGLSWSEINSLYNTYQSSDAIRGFNIDDPLAGGKQYWSSDLVGSVDNVNLDLSADILSHRTASVQNQLNDLDLNRNNSFADQYDDRFDALISKVQAALTNGDFSSATLTTIKSDLDALINVSNPYRTGSGLDASEQMVLAPIYNLLAGNTENGLSDLLDGVVELRTAMSGTDFNAILTAAANALDYDDFETLFKTSNYDKAQDAYAKASALIDEYLIYAAGQPDMENLPDAVINVLKEIKILDRSATRFEAFVDALDGGFDFNTFRSSYLANQAEVQTFIANHPEYVSYLQSESRFEAMVGSLTQDAKDTITLAALNEQQYQLLLAARNQAVSDFAGLTSYLRSAYTVTLNYWWFSRTVQLDYTVDYRYVQQKELVDRLNTQLAQAGGYYSASDSQISRLNGLLTGYEGEETTLEDQITALGSQYEAAKDALNAQYLVLKELSGFAVEVIKARGPDQNIDGFADDSSLISEMISFYDQYSIIDEDATQNPLDTNQFLTEVRDDQGNLVRDTTESSVIFKEDKRDYTAVTSVTGMTKQGVAVHVGYDDVENLTIKTGAGDDTVQVKDTLGQSSAEVHVQTNGGADEITVSDENDTTEGVTSHLVVDAGMGNNKLHMNDIADATGDTITMTNSERTGYTSVTGLASGQIHYKGSYGQGVFLQAGIGKDDITIDGVIADAHTTILAGAGDDDITVTSNTTRSGTDNTALTIKGEDGLDVIDGIDSGFALTIEGNLGADTIYGSAHDDDISGNEGDDLIIAGLGADTVSGDAGDDIILGDLGNVTDENGDEMTRRAGVLTRVASLTGGSGDTITGGTGNDTIIGGAGGDTITDNSGNELVFGDHALITYLAGMTAVVASRHSNEGGDDNITITDGDNTVLGGSGKDWIKTADGNDFVLGDNGEIRYTVGELTSVSSTDTAVGDNDDIDLGKGNKTVIAGVGNDTVDTGVTGTQRVIGDNGTFTYDAGALRSMTSDAHADAGQDTITLNGDMNQVIAGSDDDTIRIAVDSTDHLLGDNGTINFTGAKGAEQVVSIQSDLAETGGDDTIELADGDKVVIAGDGNDTVTITATSTTDADQRIVLGDEGSVSYAANDSLVIVSTSTAGGNDRLSINGGHSDDLNIIVAGTNDATAGDGTDHVTVTGNSTDLVLGDNGEIRRNNGVVTSIKSTDTAFGGNDKIDLGNGAKTVIAGLGDDTVEAGTGHHRVIGDNGELSYSAGELIRMSSTAAALGGNLGGADSITLGDGENQIIAGVGDDNITTGNGTDHILADNGNLIFDGATQILRSANSADDTLGGNDTLLLGNGHKTVIAGIGEDDVTAGNGSHHVLGDHGQLKYHANGILQQAINNGTAGAKDRITLNQNGSGDNVIIAGAGGDTVITGNGTDFLLGDHGVFNFDNRGIITSGRSTDTGTGGDDTLTLGNGDKLVIGGFGGDTIQAGNGANRVLGDNGELLFSNGILQTIDTQDTTDTTGGVDNITLGSGEHIAMGGTHGDTINSGTGDAILIGDNGTATFDATGKRVKVISELSTLGGDDVITAAGGDNLVLGGVGNDTITTGAGADRVFGDNGQLNYLNGILNRIETTDQSEATGGIDTIEAGDGDNMVFGGTHGDDIDSGIGNSILMGDNGFVQLNNAGDQRVQVVSELSTLGGDDDINARGGNNLAFGSVGDDRIETGAGDDVIFGDNGVADYINGLADHYYTTDTTMDTSGDDDLTGGAGDDLIFGGLGNELIHGDAGNDSIVGDLGEAYYNTDDTDPTTLDRVFSKNSDIGGEDEIHGGADNDVIIGGAKGDKLFGDEGDDFISGDGGLGIFRFGELASAETTELFIGGDDELHGGADNDILFGGFGHDLFFGNLNEDAMAGEYARALIDTSKDGFEQGVFVVRLGQGDLDLIAKTQFGLYNDKLGGIGFSPVGGFTPISDVGFITNGDGTQTSQTEQQRNHSSGLAGNSATISDVLGSLDKTAAGETEESTEEQEACFNEQGMEIECPVEEQPAEDAQEAETEQATDAEAPETSQTGEQPVAEEPVEGQSEEQTELQPEEKLDQAAASGTAAAIAALAGWKVAKGERSGAAKLAQKGFSELRHQQRRVQRWDDVKQCFVETNERKVVTSSDWEQAVNNIKKH